MYIQGSYTAAIVIVIAQNLDSLVSLYPSCRNAVMIAPSAGAILELMMSCVAGITSASPAHLSNIIWAHVYHAPILWGMLLMLLGVRDMQAV